MREIKDFKNKSKIPEENAGIDPLHLTNFDIFENNTTNSHELEEFKNNQPESHKNSNNEHETTQQAQELHQQDISSQQYQKLLKQQTQSSIWTYFNIISQLKPSIISGCIIALILIITGCIVSFAVSSYIRSQQTYDLVKLNSISAKCIDGSSYAYYVSRTGNSSNILLLMVGGAWCGQQTYEKTIQCFYNRSKTHLGSSLYSPQTRTISQGVLSNHDFNYFRDWKKIFLTYCDGSGYQGTKKEPITYNNTELYFRGHNNTVQAFEDIQAKLGLFSKAQKVVLSGQSAGGVAVYTWANYLQSRIKKGQLLAISDSAIFYDTEGKTNISESLKLNYANLMNITNQEIDFPVSQCVQRYPFSKENCFFVQNLIQHIKVPIFHLQSVYDKWVMQYTLKISCMGKKLNSCSEQDTKTINENRQNVTNVLNQIAQRKVNGVWGIKCLSHVVIIYGSYMNKNLQAPFEDIHYVLSGKSGLTASEAIASWMQNPEGQNVHIDNSQLEGDGFCQ